ncbi:hypothetical protein PRUPE_7G193400 [Prunus persica]|uniref:Uncharacterized protein n=1 Tax=Prunus persica TaxID=3760 RepID=M5WEV5_PRUPE|nr:hypothetical protein PRUPE_7G193400 [Prunus persica]
MHTGTKIPSFETIGAIVAGSWCVSKLFWFESFKFMWAFAKKYKLPSTLLSEQGNKVRKWGVPSDLFGTLPGRQMQQPVTTSEAYTDETLKLLQSL